MKKVLIFILTLILVLVFIKTKKKEKTNIKTIKIGFFGELLNKNPQLSTDINSTFLLHPLYRSLFSYNEDGIIVKDLVKSFRWKSPLLLNLRIKKNIKFSDGSLLTTETVKDNVRFFSNRRSKFPYSSEFQFIEKVLIKDDSILIKLKKPFSPIFSYLTIPILPSKWLGVEKNFPPTLKGFKILKFKEGKYFTFKKENKIFKIFFIKDKITAILKLVKGDIDLIAGYRLKTSIKNPNITRKDYKINMLYYLIFNLKNRKVKDLKFRKFIRTCINLNDFKMLLKNNYYYSSFSILLPGYSIEVNFKKKEEKYYNNPPKISILVNAESELRKAYATIIKSQLEKCKIKTKIITVEYSSYLNRLKHRLYDVAIGGFIFDSDPNQKDLWHSSGSMNYSGLKDKEIDKLIEEGISETVPFKRKLIYKRLSILIMEKLPVIFLPTPYFSIYYRKNLRVKIPSLVHSNSSIFDYINEWEKF